MLCQTGLLGKVLPFFFGLLLNMSIVDLRAVKYVEKVNENLICCICQTPFIDPVTTPCGHTFCLQCIQQALESSNLCPIDRAVISHELQPAIKIISNMVNELLVHCTQEGCDFTCQRQLIESHIKNDCQYTMTCCELEECQELFLKRDLGSHTEKCQFRTSKCFMCKKKLKVFELQSHFDLCPAEIIECTFCKTSRSRLEHTSHIDECPQYKLDCNYRDFGCSWKGERQDLSDHLANCPYEALKGYLHQQQQTERSLREDILRLSKENQSLKCQQYEMQQRMDSVLDRLCTMFPNHFSPDLDMIPEEARNESVMVENQRVTTELETLSANLASLELKQNMALMTETFRLQEELQSIRAVCHGLRMQMHYLMMDRKSATATSPAAAAAAGSGSKVSGNDNESRHTGAMGSLDRMRNWLGMLCVLV
ncbi:unnamed protein product [Rhizopus microsporus]